jgi:hypothetical protein
MSEGGNTITEKLKIILKNDNYKFQETISGMLFSADIGFTDNGAAYSRFWNKYKRPPAKEYQQHIIDRRDLLVPQNIREVKGSFFTPKIWADKSKEYMEKVFGKNWQDEYYIWDCAAGTGNLLAGLSNPYNVWASGLEQGNVETIQSLIDIDENLNLLPGHVFQFDFLNDSFDTLLAGFVTANPCQSVPICGNPCNPWTLSQRAGGVAGLAMAGGFCYRQSVVIRVIRVILCFSSRAKINFHKNLFPGSSRPATRLTPITVQQVCKKPWSRSKKETAGWRMRKPACGYAWLDLSDTKHAQGEMSSPGGPGGGH